MKARPIGRVKATSARQAVSTSRMLTRMPMRTPIHTSNTEVPPVFHWMTECQYAKEILRGGTTVDGVGDRSRKPCEECLDLEKG
jgi:hypothetical protein